MSGEIKNLQVIEDFFRMLKYRTNIRFFCTFILDSVIMAGEYKERKGWDFSIMWKLIRLIII